VYASDFNYGAFLMFELCELNCM